MREIVDGDGRTWEAEVASHGRTSDYLNPKVHRPIVQFTCRSAPLPRRYASLPRGRDALDLLSPAELTDLLARARSH